MTDRILFSLNDNRALGYDDRQWMVMNGRLKNGETTWRPVSFVASNKLALKRVMNEMDITPTTQAQHSLDQLPERFSDWFATIDQKKEAA
jgi:hypothetical protein